MRAGSGKPLGIRATLSTSAIPKDLPRNRQPLCAVQEEAFLGKEKACYDDDQAPCCGFARKRNESNRQATKEGVEWSYRLGAFRTLRPPSRRKARIGFTKERLRICEIGMCSSEQVVLLFSKLEAIICRRLLEPISCRGGKVLLQVT